LNPWTEFKVGNSPNPVKFQTHSKHFTTDSQSPIQDYGGVQQDAVLGVQDALFSIQDAFTYDFEDASMTHSITVEEGMLLGAPPPPQD
jgi:hypothetical protein